MKLVVQYFVISFFILSLAKGADVVSIWGGARQPSSSKLDGTVWTWGANFNGKLARETNTVRSSVPVEVHGAGNVSYLNSVRASWAARAMGSR